MLRAPTLLLLSGFAACSTVEWQQPPSELPERWRDYRLFVSDQAYVLARDGSAAADSYDLIANVRRRLSQRQAEVSSNADLGRPLILALSYEDPLPIPEPEAWSAAVQGWQRQLLGIQGDFQIGNQMQVGPKGKQVEIDPAVALHMLSTPIVGDDARLALPTALVSAADCVVLLPTESGTRAAADVMIDAALEAQGISSFSYAAMKLVVGDPADKMWEEMAKQATETLAKTWARARGIELETADASRPGNTPPGRLPAGWHELVLPGARTAASAPWFVVGELRGTTVIENGPWRGYVDTFPYISEQLPRLCAANGREYLHVPDKGGLPTRTDVDRLEELRQRCGDDGYVFVAGKQEFGAALVASHALWHLGKPRQEAMLIAEYYGIGDRAAELGRHWQETK
ncbi:MAG: hypothetical protein NXI31_03985 [bacterium]|nr:hypothetical protein [bacterium]